MVVQDDSARVKPKEERKKIEGALEAADIVVIDGDDQQMVMTGLLEGRRSKRQSCEVRKGINRLVCPHKGGRPRIKCVEGPREGPQRTEKRSGMMMGRHW